MTVIRVANKKSLRCPHCGGNPYLESIDEPELRCLQCSRLIVTLASDPSALGCKLPAAA